MIPFFSQVSNTYNLGTTTASANLVMSAQTVTPNTVVKVDNAGPNVAYIKFSTALIGNVDHPTAGSSGSASTISILPSQTVYLNPNLGFHTGNLVVSGINAAGTSTLLITVGATL